jgi:hypothetical protein
MQLKTYGEFSSEWHKRWRDADPTQQPALSALRAKRAYMHQYGLGRPSYLGDVRQNEALSLALAVAYRDMPSTPDDHATALAYRAFIVETQDQYQALLYVGRLQPVFTTDDPYADMPELLADVKRGSFRVFATGEDEHPLMTARENDLFRAVHDFYGHCATGRTFDRHGEEAAYRSHAEMYSPLARRALATETRGQNAGLIWTGTFVEQKAGLLPAWAWEV